MAALTCSYASCTYSWKEAAEQQGADSATKADVATYEDSKRRLTGKIVSKRRSDEEEVWEGVVTRKIGAGVEQVWDMLGDFGGMMRWNAIAEVCELVEGAEGEVGCVRYCAGGGRWVKEKLLALHPTQRCFTYTIIDSSYGFQGYVATLSILPLFPSHALAHWTFELEPVPHLTQSKLLDLLTFIFDRMMCSLEDTICSAPNASSIPLEDFAASE